MLSAAIGGSLRHLGGSEAVANCQDKFQDPPSRPHEIEELGHRRPSRSFFVGGALLAVLTAAGAVYLMMMASEKSVAMPPTAGSDDCGQ